MQLQDETARQVQQYFSNAIQPNIDIEQPGFRHNLMQNWEQVAPPSNGSNMRYY